MKQLTDVQAFQQSPLPKPSRNPQYMYRAAENAVPELLPFGNSDDVSQTTIEERMLFAAVVPVLAVIASMERRAR